MMTNRTWLLAAGLGLQGLTFASGVKAESPASHTVPASGATLSTPYQFATEREILRIMSSAPMKAEIARVEALYAADPQGKTPAGKARIKQAAHSIAVAATQYAVVEDTGRLGAFWSVNAPHTWGGLKVPRSGYGIDNPDNVYRNIMVDAGASYEIHGRIKQPGPAELHFEMRDAIPGTTEMTAEGGKQLSTLRSDQIVSDSEGRFVITVDNQPAKGRVNHLQTPETGQFLVIVRDLFTDWTTQNPVALDVRWVGGKPLATPRSTEANVARSVELVRRQRQWHRFEVVI